MAVGPRTQKGLKEIGSRAAGGESVILTVRDLFGSSASLDFTKQFGESVELQCFSFVTPPIEFRLVRGNTALQEWQAGNTETYDLQHGPGVEDWSRRGHLFVNDLHHRHDVMTCGVLSKNLVMETRGLAWEFVLHVWLRETTIRSTIRIVG